VKHFKQDRNPREERQAFNRAHRKTATSDVNARSAEQRKGDDALPANQPKPRPPRFGDALENMETNNE
jgi:hypothetical protein